MPASAVRDRRRPRRRGRVPDRRAGLRLGRAAALSLARRSTRRSWSCATRASRARCSRRRSPPASRPPAGTRCSAACCRRPAASLLVRRYGFDLGGGGLGLPQPVPRQRHQVLRPRRHEALRRAGGARSRRRARRADAAAAQPGGACASCTARPTTTCASSSRASSGLDLGGHARPARLRERRHLPRRARDLPPPRRRRRRDRRRARRAQHQRRLRLDAHRARSRERMREGGHDVGFAFDGDGDRVLAVDRDGTVVDGDELIALAALHLRERRPAAGRRRRGDGDDQLRLPPGDGGRRASRSRPPTVGDRYVLDELLRRGWALGGEQSGHIIDTRLRAVRRRHRRRAARRSRRSAGARPRRAPTRWRSCPQALVNVRVPTATRSRARRASGRRSSAEAAALEGRGRVLVRPSAPSRSCA